MCCKTEESVPQRFAGEGIFLRCPQCGGYHRETTPALFGLVSEACAALVPSAQKIAREFHADRPDARWHYNSETALFSLSAPGHGTSLALYHHIGRWEEQTGAFQWAWDFEDSERPDNIKAAQHARQVGQHYGLRALMAPNMYLGGSEARQMTMVAAYLSDLPMVAMVGDGTATQLLAMERPVRVN